MRALGLVKTGGRLVKHAPYYWLLLAESHLTQRLFGSMVRRIGALATGEREAVDAAKSGGQGWGPERCLCNSLKSQDLPVLDFPARATGALCRTKDGSRRKNATRRTKGWHFGLY